MHTLFKTIPRLARVLAPTTIAHYVLTARLWVFFLLRKSGYRGDTWFTFVFHGTSFKLALRHAMDVAVLREIFLDKEYEWVPMEVPRVIVDLGAHFGDTALYYHTRFPTARIIAVEPSPENFARLEKNVAGIAAITAVQAAVGATDGEVTLHLMPSTLGHSVQERAQSTEAVTVPQLTLTSLLARCQVAAADLIKCDIEGAEFAVMTADAIARTTAFVGEVHTDLVPGSTIEEFASRFTAHTVEVEPIAGRGRYLVRAVRRG